MWVCCVSGEWVTAGLTGAGGRVGGRTDQVVDSREVGQ